jgi:hypothetical protein
VREDGRLVGGNVWKGRYITEGKEEARKCRNLRISMNESGDPCRVLNGLPKFRNATIRHIMPILLSICASAMNKLSRNVCGFFENLT